MTAKVDWPARCTGQRIGRAAIVVPSCSPHDRPGHTVATSRAPHFDTSIRRLTYPTTTPLYLHRNVRRQQHPSPDLDRYPAVSLYHGLAHTRLMKEYKDLTADPLQDTITAGPVSEDNMLEWEALIQGPEGTPYVCCNVMRPLISGRRSVCCEARLCALRG